MLVQTATKSLAPQASEMSYEAFLAKLAPKDRINAEKHVAFRQTDPDPRHVALWRQIACHLMSLAGHSAKLNRNPPSAQFYTVDGRYRMQVFAIEDESHGELRIYCGDALEQATQCGVLGMHSAGDDVVAYFTAESGEPLLIERLDGDTINPSPWFKDMLGWNRKGIRITLPISASLSQRAAVLSLCSLSVALPSAALVR